MVQLGKSAGVFTSGAGVVIVSLPLPESTAYSFSFFQHYSILLNKTFIVAGLFYAQIHNLTAVSKGPCQHLEPITHRPSTLPLGVWVQILDTAHVVGCVRVSYFFQVQALSRNGII